MRFFTVEHKSGYDTVAFIYADGQDFVSLLKYDLITYPYSYLWEKRQELWKLQGNILGSMIGEC